MRISTLSKFLFICTAVVLSTSCSSKKTAPQRKTGTELISLPTIPSVLISDEDRTVYMLEHYWQKFHWSDTTVIGTEALNAVFNQWLSYLYSVPEESAAPTCHHIITDGCGNPGMQMALFALAETSLNNPNSPYRNDELFIPVLEAVTADSLIPEISRMRPEYLLQQLSKNRKGTTAADLQLTLVDGRRTSMKRIISANTKYTILYFFNPDCNDCHRVGRILETDPTICDMNRNGSLNIIAIYPDEDLTSWNKMISGSYPGNWLIGRLATEEQRKKYYLPAIPNIYLLDKNLQVILKDAQIETIIQTISL